MGVMVRIPTPLRRMTNGQDKLEMDPSTLSVMIDSLEASYPGFKERLIDENGELRYFVNIYLNGEDVRFLTRRLVILASEDVGSLPVIKKRWSWKGSQPK